MAPAISGAVIHLQQCHVLADAWEAGLKNWLSRQSVRPWEQPKPVVIVTPDVGRANALRQQLLQAKLPVLGIEFWQVRDLRSHLGRVFGMTPPLDDGRLLEARVRSVAHELTAESPTDPVARAFARSGKALADTITMLQASGWGDEQIEASALRRVAKKFVESNGAMGVIGVGPCDFQLLAKANAAGAEPVFASVLIAGFDALQWEHWPLLAAAARLSEEAYVTLPVAHEAAGEAEMVWCSSWEQLAGSESEVCEAEAPRHPDLGRLAIHLDSYAQRAIDAADRLPVLFVAAENLVEEARSVALRAAKLVASGCKSVGILVPGPGPLARELTLTLDRTGIEHYTTLPGYSSPVPHAGSWPSLLHALDENTTDALCAFLRSNGDLPGRFTQGLGATALTGLVERCAEDMLITDLPVVRSVLDARKETLTQNEQALRGFMSLWPVLPAFAPLGQFLAMIRQFTDDIGWDEIAGIIADAQRAYSYAEHMPLSREAVIEWLKVSLPARRGHRTETNSNPYAAVQILTPSEAVWRTWDYLIFAGQVEGAWPPPLRPAGYLGEEIVHNLNQQARKLNETGTSTGLFGDGMTVVADGKGYCVGPLEQRQMHLRDLIRLLCSATGGIVFSAALADETDGGRVLQPGDFYRRVFCAIAGGPLDAAGLRSLMDASPAPTWQAMPKAARVPVTAVREAWHARNSGDTLSEFEFTLGGRRCTFDVAIAPSAWAAAFTRPAEVFLNAYLGVRAAADVKVLPLRAALGIWTHRFLEHAARTAPSGEPTKWAEACERASAAHRATMVAALAHSGRDLPSWWHSVWAQAKAKAQRFAHEAGAASQGFVVVPEARIKNQLITLRSGRRLRFSSRLDLVLSSVPVGSALTFCGGSQRVIDYKSGSDKPLRGVKSLQRFEGLQVALYLLALLERGAGDVDAALLTDTSGAAAQMSKGDVLSAEAQEVFDRLAEMQDLGLFGWTGTVRDRYTVGCSYPLATIAPVINITGKFRRTHER